MPNIAELMQNEEDCKTKLTLGVARLVYYGVPEDKIVQFLEVFKDYVTAKQALQLALQIEESKP